MDDLSCKGTLYVTIRGNVLRGVTSSLLLASRDVAGPEWSVQPLTNHEAHVYVKGGPPALATLLGLELPRLVTEVRS